MAMALMVGAAAISAIGSIAQGKQAKYAAEAEAKALDYNAASDRAAAERAGQVAGIQEDEQRRRARAQIGTQLASSAEAGGGLNSDLLRQSIFDSEQDTANIRYEGNMKRAGLNDSATLQTFNAGNARARGKAAQTAGYLNAASSLMGAGNSYMKTPKAG